MVLGAKVRRKDTPHQTAESGPLPSLQTTHSQPHSLKKHISIPVLLLLLSWRVRYSLGKCN